jgi:hypothetical protein
VTETPGGGLHQVDHIRIERHRLEPGQDTARDGDALGRCQGGAVFRQPTLGFLQHGLVGVAQVDGDRGRRRHDVDEVGRDVTAPDGGDLVAAELEGEPAGEDGDLAAA